MERSARSLGVLLLLLPCGATASDCPPWRLDSAKTKEILLYFPAADDPSFPAVTWGSYSSSGAKAFKISDLDPAMLLPAGITEASLIARIVAAVREDYCELDVRVISTRDACCPAVPPCTPCPAASGTVLVAVGTDVGTTALGTLYGLSDMSSNLARVWAGTYNWDCLPTTPVLDDLVNAISGVTSHEAGHRYGLWHSHAAAKPGEDTKKHIMSTSTSSFACLVPCDPMCDPACGDNCCQDPLATASHPPCDCCVCCADRAKDRYFSDTSYGVLATAVGLCSETLHNWDFTNPNTSSANEMEIEVLSEDPALTRTWYWSGSSSPWTDPMPDPTPFGTETIGTTAYNKFKVHWVTPNPIYSTPGVLPGGGDFHTGIAFSSPKPIIVRNVVLKSGGSALTLSPRMVGYDSGTITGPTPCLFDLTFYNPDQESGALCVSDLTVRFLPRMADLDTMNRQEESEPRTREGLPINVLETLSFPEEICLAGGGTASITLRELTRPRFLDLLVAAGGGDPTEEAPRLALPAFQRIVGLFPSIYSYVTAKVTDPATSQESRLFYQFAGIRPDCNSNDIDDLLDIDSGDSLDTNETGMPDECEHAPFRRGDADGNGTLQLTDAVNTLGFLFLGGPTLTCLDAADTSDAGKVDITAAIYLLTHLFLGGPPPPAPHPDCGPDPTGDALGCATSGCP
ncbi:MAG: hypothetical protein HY721_30760 [Planctomycetes bacterium]|nr:hypothetical protein [Planctomycetota bacterium]